MTHESTSSNEAVSPRSRLYQGPYGRLFGDLAPWRPTGADGKPMTDNAELEAFCLEFANQHMIEAAPDGIPTPPHEVDEPAMNTEFKSVIPAGYTYFGQFIDHDITFDPASSLQRVNDPNKLANFRTPRLDLDNLYGRGPDDQPYLYDTDQPDPTMRKFLVGDIAGTSLHDLPRNSKGRALIGDPRNDENSIVSQLHLAFLLAHNELVDRAIAKGVPDAFTAARTTLRWLYQWVVWHDFVNRITERAIHGNALTPPVAGTIPAVWTRGLTDVYDWHDQPYMPVEFSGAAYRFGHSMVRSKYNTNVERGAGDGDLIPIFDNSGTQQPPDHLFGFGPVTHKNAIQWDWFLPMASSRAPRFPQRAHRIDTKLANALAFLHEGKPGDPNNVLAARNLLRGIQLELPSGVDVAKKLGATPIKIEPEEPGSLWFYVLKEAEAGGGEHLGEVGSTIVAAVFAGLLDGDPQSWINVQPRWTPDTDLLLEPGEDNIDSPGSWELSSIIQISGVPTASPNGAFP